MGNIIGRRKSTRTSLSVTKDENAPEATKTIICVLKNIVQVAQVCFGAKIQQVI